MPALPELGPRPDACETLSLDRLQALDPGDAWPWLARLQDSQVRGDDAGVAQALYQLAQGRHEARQVRPLAAAIADLVSDDPTPAEALAMVQVIGMDAALPLDGSVAGVGRVCRGDALKDANRRELCVQVARVAPRLATEAFEALVLLRLQENLGMAPQSPEPSRASIDRAVRAMVEESQRWMAEPTCDNLRRMGRQVFRLARGGELAWIRAYLKTQAASAPR